MTERTNAGKEEPKHRSEREDKHQQKQEARKTTRELEKLDSNRTQPQKEGYQYKRRIFEMHIEMARSKTEGENR